MDGVKRSFDKVKEDMDSLRHEIDSIKSEIRELRDSMVDICEIVNNLQGQKTEQPQDFPQNASYESPNYPTERHFDSQTDTSTGFSTDNNTPNADLTNISTQNTQNSTDSTNISTGSSGFSWQKGQNFSISTRNQGVPTDRQTNRQTDRQTDFSPETDENGPQGPGERKNSFNDAVGILDSLDNIKKDLRLKFKRLTDQEFLVFSTLYQLADQEGSPDYKTLSKNLNLSGSSIRDYVGRLIEKGIPVEKNRVNNKNIQLNVSSDLKKIASLPTIMELRDI